MTSLALCTLEVYYRYLPLYRGIEIEPQSGIHSVFVVFRSAKARPFAERKATLLRPLRRSQRLSFHVLLRRFPIAVVRAIFQTPSAAADTRNSPTPSPPRPLPLRSSCLPRRWMKKKMTPITTANTTAIVIKTSTS